MNLDEQLKQMIDAIGSDEVIDGIATIIHKLYTKLIEKGFTPEQAILFIQGMASRK